NMLVCWDGHECVRRKRFGIDTGQHLPFLPAIIVLSRRQAERCKWFRPFKNLIAPFAGKESREKRVIRLANHHYRVTVLPHDHIQVCFPSTPTLSTHGWAQSSTASGKLAKGESPYYKYYQDGVAGVMEPERRARQATW